MAAALRVLAGRQDIRGSRVSAPRERCGAASGEIFLRQKEREEIRHSARAAVYHRDDLTMQRIIRVENSNLKDQFEQIRRQRQSVALFETDALGPIDKTIRKEFELINTDVKDTCSSVDAGIPNAADIVAREGAGGAVELWARRLARCSFGQFVISALDSGIRDFDIVRSLATVGLCSIVFDSRFPDFTSRESPLLDQYRKHILIRGAKREPTNVFELE